MADIMLSCTNPAVLPVMKYVMKKSRNYSGFTWWSFYLGQGSYSGTECLSLINSALGADEGEGKGMPPSSLFLLYFPTDFRDLGRGLCWLAICRNFLGPLYLNF